MCRLSAGGVGRCRECIVCRGYVVCVSMCKVCGCRMCECVSVCKCVCMYGV